MFVEKCLQIRTNFQEQMNKLFFVVNERVLQGVVQRKSIKHLLSSTFLQHAFTDAIRITHNLHVGCSNTPSKYTARQWAISKKFRTSDKYTRQTICYPMVKFS